ncbi:helix-turn-helix transcriptional regulator [Paraburkholderia bengalensis]|uniref:Helix-turn-helix transcriptional regulator n=1 Tax=Paraburkholderia bengalensis TaxID=2747562 RepID=A0ABU8IZR2_9BURK
MEKIDVTLIHKALANPIRREILHWLRTPEVYFPDQEIPLELGVYAATIDRRCGLAQSTVSAHFSVLTRAGLVTSRRVSASVCFKRNKIVLRAFVQHMNAEL